MNVETVVSDFLAVNCYVVSADAAADAGANGRSNAASEVPQPCVLVDAGLDAAEGIAEVCARADLRPVAVLLTHGHPDHVLGLPAILERWQIPVYLGSADSYRLDDPIQTLGPEFAAMMGALAADWRRPQVNDWHPGAPVLVDGLAVRGIGAPGHTEGSTLWELSEPGQRPPLFTGDVLFASSIGRTDLPGGDSAIMQQTLDSVIRKLPEATPVYPGHGPSTTIGRELEGNPFL
ncbi:MBL fold metallo-hydrolase [Saxibacter everestensis]|uniref:MBL fold metallo-hydrolase n=1 Tax=Saxibacter everestensis TaxID=2909229 RepID=A0ABY8QZP4_9MICO|nr:MBL fold metallo-hydrolase [Brevibacteriaceae bacterium ZFBP1038]